MSSGARSSRTIKYQDETTLNNTSYSANLGIDWQTIENLSGRISGAFNQGLTSAPAGGSRPLETRNISDTQTIEAVIRWGGPSLLTLEGGASYSNVGYSSIQYVASEFDKSSASLSLFYHGGGPLRVGIGVRADSTRTPQAFVDPATGQVQSTRLDGQYVDLMADYDVTGQIVANGRLSYTRQANSGGGDTDLSGWTGALGLSWQATGKISLRVDAARDAGFNSTSYTTFAFTQTATGIAFTPIVGVFQNNTDHDIGGHQRDLRGNRQDLDLRERSVLPRTPAQPGLRDRRTGRGCDRHLEHLFARGQLPDHAQLGCRLHPGV